MRHTKTSWKIFIRNSLVFSMLKFCPVWPIKTLKVVAKGSGKKIVVYDGLVDDKGELVGTKMSLNDFRRAAAKKKVLLGCCTWMRQQMCCRRLLVERRTVIGHGEISIKTSSLQAC